MRGAARRHNQSRGVNMKKICRSPPCWPPPYRSGCGSPRRREPRGAAGWRSRATISAGHRRPSGHLHRRRQRQAAVRSQRKPHFQLRRGLVHTVCADRMAHPSGRSDAHRYLRLRMGAGVGGQRQDIAVGDVIWTEPGVKHWHGGTADTAMTTSPFKGSSTADRRLDGTRHRRRVLPMNGFATGGSTRSQARCGCLAVPQPISRH